MKIAAILLPLILLQSCSDPKIAPASVIDYEIGAPLPEDLDKEATDMGEFKYLSVPIKNNELRAMFSEANLFADSRSNIVAGFRADSAIGTMSDCETALTKAGNELRKLYPEKYLGSDSRYQFKSVDSKIVAGLRCDGKAVSRLTMEVTNPSIEEPMMQRAYNES